MKKRAGCRGHGRVSKRRDIANMLILIEKLSKFCKKLEYLGYYIILTAGMGSKLYFNLLHSRSS